MASGQIEQVQMLQIIQKTRNLDEIPLSLIAKLCDLYKYSETEQIKQLVKPILLSMLEKGVKL